MFDLAELRKDSLKFAPMRIDISQPGHRFHYQCKLTGSCPKASSGHKHSSEDHHAKWGEDERADHV